MKYWKLIKTLNFKQFISLFGIFIKFPLFVYPVLKATSSSMLIAQKEFPDIHGKSNKANAFRHALWSVLLIKELSKWSRNLDKVVWFTQKITTWHENFSPNAPLDCAMDLHNNQRGIDLALQLLKNKVTTQIIISFLKQQLQTSVQIASVNEIARYPQQLVYITP